MKLGQKKGYNVICIVRSEEKKEHMKKIGAKHVLNYNDAKFDEELKELSA